MKIEEFDKLSIEKQLKLFKNHAVWWCNICGTSTLQKKLEKQPNIQELRECTECHSQYSQKKHIPKLNKKTEKTKKIPPLFFG